jgi:hypothetical protein
MHEYLASGHNVDEEGNESKPLCTEITTRTWVLLIEVIRRPVAVFFFTELGHGQKKVVFWLNYSNCHHNSCFVWQFTHKVFLEWLVGDLVQAAQNITTISNHV